MSAPLAGLTVLELASGVGAAYATRCMALLGARVIKVERPGGDPLRFQEPLVELDAGPASALWLYLDCQKESVELDVDSGSGRSFLAELVGSADLVIDALGHQGGNWRVSDEWLQAANPRVTAVHVSPFGPRGPYADFEATDLVLQALSGLMANSGDPDRPPLRLFGEQAGYLTGAHALAVALAALRKSQREAAFVSAEVTGMLAATNIMVPILTSWAYNEQFAGRRGQGRGIWAIYPCLDGFVSLSVYHTGREWGDFVRMTGIERLKDPIFETVGGRLEHVEELEVLVLEWMADRTKAELFELGRQYRIAIGPAATLDEVANNTQLQERGFFRDVTHGTRAYRTPGLGAELSATPWDLTRGAPALDEHQPVEPATPGSASPATEDRPLAGIRVLDVTTMLAGPYATRILADLGAEVIKFEAADRYDLTRGPLWKDPRARVYPDGEPGDEPFNRASYYNELNRNKLGVSLNLKDEAGREAFLRLAETADIVIDNFSAGTVSRLGIGFDEVRARNPRIISISMPSFGSAGPWRDRVAYGSTIEMLSGMGSLTGYADGLPMTSGITYGDPVAGVHAAALAIAAIRHRDLTGEGQRIDLSQLECLVGLIGEYVTAAGLGKEPPARSGNRIAGHVVSGAFPTAGDDEWLVIDVVNEAQWQRLCGVAGLAEVLAPWRDASPDGLATAIDDIESAITGWTADRSAADAMFELQRAGVPAGTVLHPRSIHTDPQFEALGYLELVEHPAAGTHRMPGAPWKFMGDAPVIRRPAPLFGEHTEVVLRELARLSPQEVAELTDRGVTAPLSAAR